MKEDSHQNFWNVYTFSMNLWGESCFYIGGYETSYTFFYYSFLGSQPPKCGLFAYSICYRVLRPRWRPSGQPQYFVRRVFLSKTKSYPRFVFIECSYNLYLLIIDFVLIIDIYINHHILISFKSITQTLKINIIQ